MRVSRFLAAGLFVAAAVLVVEAQPGGFGGFGGGPNALYTTVLSNKALQEELKITDAQKEKFKSIAEKTAEAQKKRGESYKEKFQDAAGDKDKFKDLFAEMQKENAKDQEETKKAVEPILTADQIKRLKQIDKQRIGVRAFLVEDTAKELSLTDSQKSKIKSVVDEYNKDVAELGGGFGKGGFKGFDKEKAAENQKKREKLTKAALADIDDVLTADQKKA